MLNVKRSTLGAVCAAALALGLAMGLAACAPKTADSVKGSSSSGSSVVTSQVAGDGTGAYVSDEQCLSCHGGSYEALAEKTADYGDRRSGRLESARFAARRVQLVRELPCERQGDHRQSVHALPRLAA